MEWIAEVIALISVDRRHTVRSIFLGVLLALVALFSAGAQAQSAGSSPDASAALTSFMEARLARNGPAALAWVTDALRARSPNGFVGFSNPCSYRYAVEAFERPSPTMAVAQVRLYTHFWAGDEMGGLPRSSTEKITLISTVAGWRISDTRGLGDFREEPDEPHGPTTSACMVGRRPAVWLMPATLPATGGLSPWVVLSVGPILIGMGFAVRRKFVTSKRVSELYP